MCQMQDIDVSYEFYLTFNIIDLMYLEAKHKDSPKAKRVRNGGFARFEKDIPPSIFYTFKKVFDHCDFQNENAIEIFKYLTTRITKSLPNGKDQSKTKVQGFDYCFPQKFIFHHKNILMSCYIWSQEESIKKKMIRLFKENLQILRARQERKRQGYSKRGPIDQHIEKEMMNCQERIKIIDHFQKIFSQSMAAACTLTSLCQMMGQHLIKTEVGYKSVQNKKKKKLPLIVDQFHKILQKNEEKSSNTAIIQPLLKVTESHLTKPVTIHEQDKKTMVEFEQNSIDLQDFYLSQYELKEKYCCNNHASASTEYFREESVCQTADTNLQSQEDYSYSSLLRFEQYINMESMEQEDYHQEQYSRFMLE